MKKLKILLILLLIVGCNKTEKIDKIDTQDTSATVEQQPLSEEEAWKLFDEFWVEFQKAVVDGDDEAIRGMYEFDCFEIDNCSSMDFFIYQCKTLLKKDIKKINKNNNYTIITKNKHIDKYGELLDVTESISIKYFDIYNKMIKENNVFILKIIHSADNYFHEYLNVWGYFGLRNNKYKLISFYND